MCGQIFGLAGRLASSSWDKIGIKGRGAAVGSKRIWSRERMQLRWGSNVSCDQGMTAGERKCGRRRRSGIDWRGSRMESSLTVPRAAEKKQRPEKARRGWGGKLRETAAGEAARRRMRRQRRVVDRCVKWSNFVKLRGSKIRRATRKNRIGRWFPFGQGVV